MTWPLHQMTWHDMTCHDATNHSSSPHVTSQPTTLLHLTPQATSWHQNRSHYHRGTAESLRTAKKWFGHGAGRSPCAHSIGKFFLCYIYSSFFFWNFRPRLARELLVEHIKLSSKVVFLIAFGHAKSKPFGFSEFDVMVFHEIYFSNLNIYRKIKRFVEQNKQNRKILATGDCKWLTHRIRKLMLMMSVIVRDFNHRRTQQTV